MPGTSWISTREQMGYHDCPVSFMYCPWPLYAIVLWAPSTRIEPPVEFVLQGSMGVPLGVGGVLLWACIRLVPNWWVQSGAWECKGSRPTLPVHHTTVVLHRSYPAAMHGRPYRYTYIPSRPPLVWGYYQLLACV